MTMCVSGPIVRACSKTVTASASRSMRIERAKIVQADARARIDLEGAPQLALGVRVAPVAYKPPRLACPSLVRRHGDDLQPLLLRLGVVAEPAVEVAENSAAEVAGLQLNRFHERRGGVAVTIVHLHV
jgi:hypothetical protein